jgi:hypothetical protein
LNAEIPHHLAFQANKYVPEQLLIQQHLISNRPQLLTNHLPHHIPQIVFGGICLQTTAQRLNDQRPLAAPTNTCLAGAHCCVVQHDGDAVLAQLLRQCISKRRLADIFQRDAQPGGATASGRINIGLFHGYWGSKSPTSAACRLPALAAFVRSCLSLNLFTASDGVQRNVMR